MSQSAVTGIIGNHQQPSHLCLQVVIRSPSCSICLRRVCLEFPVNITLASTDYTYVRPLHVQTGLAPGSSANVVDYSRPCESAEVRMQPYMSIEEAFINAWQLPGLARTHTHVPEGGALASAHLLSKGYCRGCMIENSQQFADSMSATC